MTPQVRSLISIDDVLFRVIWLDYDRDLIGLFQINSPPALPFLDQLSEVTRALTLGTAKTLTECQRQLLSIEESAKDIEFRNRAWELIRPFVDPITEELFDSVWRGKMVTRIEQQKRRHPNFIYRDLRRYLGGGMTLAALADHYHLSGGPAKSRLPETNGGPKRGRPSLFREANQMAAGVNMTKEDRRNVNRALNAFFLKESKPSLKAAYAQFKSKYYASHIRMEDGVPVPVLKPFDQIPTFGQFRYHALQNVNVVKKIQAREGTRSYLSNHRPKLGRATKSIRYFGSIALVDPTPKDIQAVSQLCSRDLVGRPHFYLVVDPFMDGICGYSLTFKNPSYEAMTWAIHNSISNKVEYCRQYGIEITEADWPFSGVHDTYAFDGGEGNKEQSGTLAAGLNCRVETIAPYRAEYKGVVEAFFHVFNRLSTHYLKGAVRRRRERGDRDPRLDACLNANDLHKIIIRSILFLNKRHISKDKLDPEMMEDNVKRRPVDLHKWSVEKRGNTRAMDANEARLLIFPRAEAKLTQRGIEHKGLHYDCLRGITEGWFVDAGQAQRTLTIAYDPRLVDHIHIIPRQVGDGFQKCSLTPRDEGFRGISWHDYELWRKKERIEDMAYEAAESQETAKLIAHTDAIQAAAADRAKRERDPSQTKSARLSGIQENRRNEQEIERQQSLGLPAEVPAPSFSAPAVPEVSPSGYIPPKKHLSALLETLDE